jgi:ubiquinone/menaquinone biosynthesis C-methylase UbiE
MSEFWDKGWKNRLEKTDHQFFIKEDSNSLRARVEKNIQHLEKTNYILMEAMPIKDKIVLNIGCGTGEAPLFTVLGAINYIGIDYSFYAARMSYEIIKKLGGYGITARANAELLPIKDNSVDLIYSCGVLHHTPEIQKTLDEVYRVIKPSGKVIIGLYNTYSPLFIMSRVIGKFLNLTRGSKKNGSNMVKVHG